MKKTLAVVTCVAILFGQVLYGTIYANSTKATAITVEPACYSGEVATGGDYPSDLAETAGLSGESINDEALDVDEALDLGVIGEGEGSGAWDGVDALYSAVLEPPVDSSEPAGTELAEPEDVSGEDVDEVVESEPIVAAAPLPPYSITLDQVGDYEFPALTQGYAQAPSKSVTVANAGAFPTGPLSITLSGADATSFTLSPTSLGSMEYSSATNFFVTPKLGLAPRLHSANVTVSGGNGISASFNVRFDVKTSPDYALTLDMKPRYDFPELKEGYGTVPSVGVLATNTGRLATGELDIALSGDAAFDVSVNSILSIPVSGTSVFYVSPKYGLTKGYYTATVTVSGENGINEGFWVTLTVGDPPPPVYAISLDVTGPYDFGRQEFGYASVPTKTVTVTNTGNVDTGVLSVGLSWFGTPGSEAFDFTSPGANLAPGETMEFTVAPVGGLAVGVYTATVKVNDIFVNVSAALDVRFEVTPLAITMPSSLEFSDLVQGLSAVGSLRIDNLSGHDTGVLTISSSGDDYAFSFDKTIPNIPAYGSYWLSVAPVPNLAVGSYKMELTVSGTGVSKASSVVSIKVVQAQYRISLDPTVIDFGSAPTGYSSSYFSPRTVRVTNTGLQPTGTLRIALSGANPSAFSLSATSLSSFKSGTSKTFTIKPKTGLLAGIYTALGTVSGSNGISVPFSVRLEVRPPIYKAGLDPTGTYEFPTQHYGYPSSNVAAKTATVTNVGDQPTGTLKVELSGHNASSFSLSTSSLRSIAAGASKTFTVKPTTATRFIGGTHTATVTVKNEINGIKESFDVKFYVIPPTYGIKLNPRGTYEFPSLSPGYTSSSLTTKSVAVENTGDQPTGSLTVKLSGANASSFSLSTSGLSSIAVGSSKTFTIKPKTKLAAGQYTATVTVKGSDGMEDSLTVRFSVKNPT